MVFISSFHEAHPFKFTELEKKLWEGSQPLPPDVVFLPKSPDAQEQYRLNLFLIEQVKTLLFCKKDLEMILCYLSDSHSIVKAKWLIYHKKDTLVFEFSPLFSNLGDPHPF